MRGEILKGILWSLVSLTYLLFKGIYCLLVPRICSLLREWETTRRNVILKCVFRLFVPPIYSWICEGYTNEDRRYAFLFLAMETVSLILDLLGGSHWGYLLASCLLSVLILETTIYANFISRSRIKPQDQQLIVQEIVFSVLQFIVSCFCLIKTLSGAKTNYNPSLFPLASAIITVVFTFKSKNDVSHSSSDPPPNDPSNESVSIPMPTGDAEARPLDKPLDSVHTSDATEDESDKSPVSVPSTSASVPQANTLRQRRKQSHFQVDPLNPTLVSAPTSPSVVFNLRSKEDVSHSSVDTPPDSPSNQFVLVSAPTSDAGVDPWDELLASVPTSNAGVDPWDELLVSVPTSDAGVDPWDERLVSVPTSDAHVDPLDEPLVSVPTSDAQVDPLDEPLVSVPTSDAKVDPLDEPLVSVPSSSASVPKANKLRQRSKQSHLQKLVVKVDLPNDKAKKKAMKILCDFSGVESVQMDMNEKKVTLIARGVDPIDVVRKLRKKICYAELLSVGPAKTSEEKQSVEKKNLEEDPHPHFGREGRKGCVIS